MPIFFDDKSLVENMREIKDDLYHDTNNIAVDRFMNIIKIAEWETFECEFKLYFHFTDVTMHMAAMSRRELHRTKEILLKVEITFLNLLLYYES